MQPQWPLPLALLLATTWGQEKAEEPPGGFLAR
jgi:hypothetical protein